MLIHNIINLARDFCSRNICSVLLLHPGRRKLSDNYYNGLVPIKMSYTSYETATPNGSNIINKQPLIIMHGLFGSKNNWNSLSKALHNRSKKKIIATDARNHGDSPHTQDFSYKHLAADIFYLMKELDVRKASVLGHSMGGRAVMTFALTFPELIESIIVVDISPVNLSSGITYMNGYFDALRSVKIDKNMSMSQARKTADEQLMFHIPELAIRQFLLTNLTQVDGGEFKWRINIDVLAKSFTKEIMNFPQISAKCIKPALFIGGLKSDYLRSSDQPAIQKLFPFAEFQYLNAGHWLHSEKPTEFIHIVTDFMERHKLITHQ